MARGRHRASEYLHLHCSVIVNGIRVEVQETLDKALHTALLDFRRDHAPVTSCARGCSASGIKFPKSFLTAPPLFEFAPLCSALFCGVFVVGAFLLLVTLSRTTQRITEMENSATSGANLYHSLLRTDAET